MQVDVKSQLLVSLAFLAISCKSPDHGLYEIDPRTFVENKITLADIADDISYIPLDDTIPIGITYSIEIKAKNIYISMKDIGIVQYDRQGTFVRIIARKGRGPGEFQYGHDFAVDERTGNIFVVDHSYITKVYSNNGTFLREISLKNIGGEIGWGGDIAIFNSLLFYPNSLGTGNSKYAWVFLDTLGNLVASKKNSVPPFQTNAGRDAAIYKFGNRLFYYNFFNDTIFAILPDLSCKAQYLFAQGEHRWPKDGITTKSIAETTAQIFKLFDPGKIIETKRFFILQYAYLEIGGTCFIDKKSKKTFLPLKLDEIPTQYTRVRKYTSNLINDLDGGLTLEGLNYYSENDSEYLTSLIDPIDLITKLSSNEFKNLTPKFPEKKKELERLAISLKETDNPVLMMVRLKK
jgi:hypothetical protein